MLWIPVLLNGQQPNLATQTVEDLLYSNETEIAPESLYHDPVDPDLQPLNLNSSSAEELERTGLFTPYQLNNLLEYREKYGEIYSIYELAAIPGFHPSKVKEIQPFIRTGPGRNNFYSRARVDVPDTGYRPPVANPVRCGWQKTRLES